MGIKKCLVYLPAFLSCIFLLGVESLGIAAFVWSDRITWTSRKTDGMFLQFSFFQLWGGIALIFLFALIVAGISLVVFSRAPSSWKIQAKTRAQRVSNFLDGFIEKTDKQIHEFVMGFVVRALVLLEGAMFLSVGISLLLKEQWLGGFLAFIAGDISLIVFIKWKSISPATAIWRSLWQSVLNSPLNPRRKNEQFRG